MDIQKIKKLIELIEETSVTEIEIKEGEESVRLSRGHTLESAAPLVQKVVMNEPVIAPQAAPTSPPSLSAAVNTANHVIKAPMVGTMYSSRSPEAPPFVTIGQTVKPGDVLCLIEAMKMFNEIETDKAGKIIEILVSNGEPVEYDQPLFIIE